MNVPEVFAAALADHQAGRTDAAEAGYRAVLRREPGHAHANNNLGILLRATGQAGEAVAFYRRAVAALPDDESIRSNFACTLGELGRGADAEAALRVALALRPDYADAWFNLGCMRRAAGDRDRAKAAYGWALRLNPAMGEALSNLADCHKEAGDVSLAIATYRKAIEAQPALPHPYVNLGEALKDQGRVTEAIAVLQTGLERHPDLALLHSNLLLTLHYSPWVPPEVIARAHAHWNERHARAVPARGTGFANDRNPDRPLRVGYVSPDFCAHACAHFIEPLLREHDRAAVETVCYASGQRQDGITGRMRALAGGWRPIAGLEDAAAAALVESDGIDILVDLGGHTADSRPLLLARKPAPVQVTWLGYPDGTGMPAVDYRLTDAVADPVGVTDGWHAETLVRLPRGFLPFQPPADVGPPAEPPVLANGFITFGSFNTLAKVTTEVVRVWSAILTRLPSSRLVLKSRAFEDPPTREEYRRQFGTHGVTPDRLDLLAQVDSVDDHLRLYDRLDVALDPFPYNGTTTSCEALWMGVPLVTLAGRHHVARVGASLLTQVGLPELIATDEAGYIDRALALAAAPDRLASLRHGMRDRLERSPLGDHRGFARSVEEAYRAMWRRWCDGGART